MSPRSLCVELQGGVSATSEQHARKRRVYAWNRDETASRLAENKGETIGVSNGIASKTKAKREEMASERHEIARNPFVFGPWVLPGGVGIGSGHQRGYFCP